MDYTPFVIQGLVKQEKVAIYGIKSGAPEANCGINMANINHFSHAKLVSAQSSMLIFINKHFC